MAKIWTFGSMSWNKWLHIIDIYLKLFISLASAHKFIIQGERKSEKKTTGQFTYFEKILYITSNTFITAENGIDHSYFPNIDNIR